MLCRIIPARAGFTRAASGSSRTGTDHPRSRGVYADGPTDAADRNGSSPLARGLLSGVRRGHAGPGIIPARAGFTHGDVPGHPLNRIIPARAGVTSASPGLPGTGRDHPRSRGVYLSRRRERGSLRGSSPLARGLPADRDILAVQRRIIPARAGFTGTGSVLPLGDRDHPRSRGVYQHAQADTAPRPRIIPARAGFTSSYFRTDSAIWDHPRSRGVYTYVDTLEGPMIGSSPLARGLRGGRDYGAPE